MRVNAVERVNGPLSWPSSSLEKSVVSPLSTWKQLGGIISLAHRMAVGSMGAKGISGFPKLVLEKAGGRRTINCRKSKV